MQRSLTWGVEGVAEWLWDWVPSQEPAQPEVRQKGWISQDLGTD